ncbi:S8 family serine peptidase [Aeoliella mucimassa]|uniref:Calcium-dependent protease n=1 Tax=Aeoliella mucimassa TaxID=2527972 RepID=A0A518ARD1_9BACT|nr:S8 family serine peptidase [Aeoliella mucimassa]QDU57281.1 Calcium-dependent protease precursor [Aeoliella mucimassa]
MGKKSKRSWWKKSRINRDKKLRSLERLEDRIVMSADPIYAEVVSNAQEYITERMLTVAFTNASNLANYSSTQLESATQWVVKTDGTVNASNFLSQTGMPMLKASTALDNTYYAAAGNLSSSSIISLLESNSNIEYFYPSVEANISTRNVTNDPYYDSQWYILNTGQEVSDPNEFNEYTVWGYDLNIEDAWEIATGEGVTVAVVDSGFYQLHPDLVNNVNTALSFNFNQGTNSPILDLEGDFHGTAVAGIIAADGNNGIGTVGVAYDANLADFRFLGTDLLGVTIDDDDIYQLFTLNNEDIEIYNHSWGEGDPSRLLAPMSPGQAQGIIDSVFDSRGNLGVIHVIASGNDAETGDTAANEAFTGSPYVVNVSGLNYSGTTASYTEGGPSILVTAPTDEILTTDLPGENGYNNSNSGLNSDGDPFPDLDYTSEFNGTSAAAPMVAGVVALMVEAAKDNGVDLTLRDVQEILVRSAYQVDATDTGGDDAGGWQVNSRPIFTDPRDVMGLPQGAIDPTYASDPNKPALSGVPESTDFQFALPANGAGYTVHDGFSYGYGHGAVDAKLAVELASNWRTLGGQTNSSIISSSFTNITVPAAETYTGAGNTFTVPGGVGGQPGFGEYYQLWADLMFDPPDELPDPLPVNSRGGQAIPIVVPANYTVEYVEVTMDFAMDSEATEMLRMTLVSPDGTYSELTNWEKVATNGGLTDTGQVTYTFTTNRHWGERTEGNGTIDPITGEVIAANANLDGNGVATSGNWQLVIENWSESGTTLNGSVDFHVANTVGPNTLGGRIKGTIGLDSNADGDYDFIGVHAEEAIVTGLDGVDEIAIANSAAMPTGDSFLLTDNERPVSGIKVYIDRNENGEWDADEDYTYTTADGNYYFDVGWNYTTDTNSPLYDYQIRFELPEGYDVVGDDMHEYRVGIQDDMSVQNYYIESNFILQPHDVTLEGNVYADFNWSNIQDAQESTIEQLRVFIDVNQNGVLDYLDYNGNRIFDNGIDEALEPMTITQPDGSYSVVLSTDINSDTDIFGNPQEFAYYTGAGRYTVMLDHVDGWIPTKDPLTAEGFAGSLNGTFSPSLAFYSINVEPGETISTGLDFGVTPEDNATISGFVYNDLNQNGTRNAGEGGLAGATVYLDMDASGDLSAGDLSVVTGDNGSYLFEGLAAGTYAIHVVPPSGYAEEDGTGPIAGQYPHVVVQSGNSAGNNGLYDFGFYDPAAATSIARDYGDLDDTYQTLATSGGASHAIVDGFFLGSGVSSEVDGQPSAGADLDSLDDGVQVLETIVAGETISINVIASSDALFLQGWIDFNNDGDFDDLGEHLSFGNAAGITLPNSRQLQLSEGLNELTFVVPNEVAAENLAARFRYGEGGYSQFNQPTGEALIGEVEDYILGSTVSTSFFEQLAGDYSGDNRVTMDDYTVWKQSVGSTVDLRADGNGDGTVNLADYTIWRDNLGSVSLPVQTIYASPAALASSKADAEDQGLEPEVVASLSSTTSSDSDTPASEDAGNAAVAAASTSETEQPEVSAGDASTAVADTSESATLDDIAIVHHTDTQDDVVASSEVTVVTDVYGPVFQQIDSMATPLTSRSQETKLPGMISTVDGNLVDRTAGKLAKSGKPVAQLPQNDVEVNGSTPNVVDLAFAQPEADNDLLVDGFLDSREASTDEALVLALEELETVF